MSHDKDILRPLIASRNRLCLNLEGLSKGIIMKLRTLLTITAGMIYGALIYGRAMAQPAPLPPPTFHHLLLNSTDPEAAIAFYLKAFPDTKRMDWGGHPGIWSPTNVLMLFNKVARPPVSDAQVTAFWHFGWNPPDQRKKVEDLQAQGFKFAPLWTGVGDGSVVVSSDTYPGAGGVYGLGETKEQMAENQAKGVKPTGGPGFAYLMGPDGALIEVAGKSDPERFNHVHMWQDQPYCAQLWYESHLNVEVRRRPGAPVYTEANCKVPRSVLTWPSLIKGGMYRDPTAGVQFSDVSMSWYMDQTDKPLVSTRGHLMDSVGLGVTDLDAWVAKLKAENVTFLRQPFEIGDTRAAMIEGPSHEALELVEVK
jgi:catechol 2,3-dioxygenase-like lactoylglutathione lyase family enzyme